ncbi:hypothetical protein JZ751_021653 [Albula glossodonta]|uniref:Thyroglobulin type-1 domain-containing protein n=1 Tax=Albula glossodonta TaxID=121402 RepID=A0A8T2NHW1_9TELE|nr:hypothetical protein JZ751_021653 [Albula glossodonta]
MPQLCDLVALVLLLAAQPASWTLASRPGPQKGCPSCRDPTGAGRGLRDQVAVEAGTATLALGEPCGVYTLSCARGLRCVPPHQDHSPLQALLQGRGICAKHTKPSPTERPHPAGPHPSHSGELEKSNRDIYIPNCDTRGFYRKKQCHSSKGMQRGLCWCVDEHGAPLPTRPEDGGLPCDGE